MKKPITKNKWFWVVVVVVALAALGNMLGLYEDKEPPANAPVSQAPIETPSSSTNESEKDAIVAAVDTLINDSLKGNGYFCELLTMADGSGYIVDIQLPANKEKPESTEIIEKVLQDIKDLQNDKIQEIRIAVLNQMKIVDQYWWPTDEEDSN